MAFAAVVPGLDEATPQRMASAGVPFETAWWYHLVGRRLTRFSERDIDRIMEVRRLVAEAGQ